MAKYTSCSPLMGWQLLMHVEAGCVHGWWLLKLDCTLFAALEQTVDTVCFIALTISCRAASGVQQGLLLHSLKQERVCDGVYDWLHAGWLPAA